MLSITKLCPKCNKLLPVNSFYKYKQKRHGLHFICKFCSKERDKLYYLNSEKRKAYFISYRHSRLSNLRIYQKEYFQKKRQPSVYYNLCNRIRSLIRISIKNNGNFTQKSLSLLGYSVKELKEQIESLFTKDMTWEKFLQGKIEIDHIIPISRLKFHSLEDESFKKCWALSNLQPLWKSDNRKKYNRTYN